MNLWQNFMALFGRRPALPKAPKPPLTARRIYLESRDLIWNDMDDVRRALGDDVKISGNRVNLRGAVLNGSKLSRSGNGQDENAPALTIRIPGFELGNGWVDDIPGGAVVKEKANRFENLKFINIGEYALSTVGKDASHLLITLCEFWNDAEGDKSVQLNQAYGAILEDCRIVGGITALRVQKDSYGTTGVNCLVRRCKFEGNETGVNVAGKATARLQSCTFTNVRKKWVTGSGSKVTTA